MKFEAAILRAIAHLLQHIADSMIWFGSAVIDGAASVLRVSRSCMDRAREWDPRLWDRDHDPRSDTRERRP
ncbi:hypothetical protein [Methylobacterium pseudosasicola]|uniref:Uncharacterized protein n=1 Tax=Methylobacterium pseudosasicola TaxID=582667 RepID=A0A1I4UQZ3_9HYPH|nr:hypothetical protein [Methylobacterium pseudosasicola]SFM91386.1 hypothetical protein SAMN05192568_107511 [Methylobacterium pseudosasicola]